MTSILGILCEAMAPWSGTLNKKPIPYCAMDPWVFLEIGFENGPTMERLGRHLEVTRRTPARVLWSVCEGYRGQNDLGQKRSGRPDEAQSRRIEVLCLQETRWKWAKAEEIGEGVKLFYNGEDTKRNGVGMAVAESSKDSVAAVQRISDRIMSLRLDTKEGYWTVMSVYAPQTGCPEHEKDEFYLTLKEAIRTLKRKLYGTARPALLYGCECWALGRAQERQLHAAEMRMLRWACGWTRRDRERNEDVRAVMKTAPIQLKMREQRLRWYGHVLRRPEDHFTRLALDFEAPEKRPRRAPKKRWKDVIKRDLAEIGAAPDDALDRTRAGSIVMLPIDTDPTSYNSIFCILTQDVPYIEGKVIGEVTKGFDTLRYIVWKYGYWTGAPKEKLIIQHCGQL
ncbi:unnamed protein product [Heligmosomoides polygyrus]|uniref:RNase H domain-containing protein n=1 Tax=Heligmosomoides polygyrus TaxID=6339 RepID=A0A3P8BGE2_HELPZ|nr:unnamed protein product [Heligmosomoides polygyrus]